MILVDDYLFRFPSTSVCMPGVLKLHVTFLTVNVYCILCTMLIEIYNISRNSAQSAFAKRASEVGVDERDTSVYTTILIHTAVNIKNFLH